MPAQPAASPVVALTGFERRLLEILADSVTMPYDIIHAETSFAPRTAGTLADLAARGLLIEVWHPGRRQWLYARSLAGEAVLDG
jgi:hypothetical protein